MYITQYPRFFSVISKKCVAWQMPWTTRGSTCPVIEWPAWYPEMGIDITTTARILVVNNVAVASKCGKLRSPSVLWLLNLPDTLEMGRSHGWQPHQCFWILRHVSRTPCKTCFFCPTNGSIPAFWKYELLTWRGDKSPESLLVKEKAVGSILYTFKQRRKEISSKLNLYLQSIASIISRLIYPRHA